MYLFSLKYYWYIDLLITALQHDICSSEIKEGHHVFDIPTLANTIGISTNDLLNQLQNLKVWTKSPLSWLIIIVEYVLNNLVSLLSCWKVLNKLFRDSRNAEISVQSICLFLLIIVWASKLFPYK